MANSPMRREPLKQNFLNARFFVETNLNDRFGLVLCAVIHQLDELGTGRRVEMMVDQLHQLRYTDVPEYSCPSDEFICLRVESREDSEDPLTVFPYRQKCFSVIHCNLR